MDNIIIEKRWHDDELLEIKITASTEQIRVNQECYISECALIKNAECILEYISVPEKESYIEYGSKTGNYTPAFSMKFLPIDVYGHMKIEMDMEINDNHTRLHRCSFYINSEIGLVEQFAHKLKQLINEKDGFYIELI